MIRKALDIAPDKGRATARARLLDRHTPGRGHRLDIATVHPQPLTAVEYTQRQRIGLCGRSTDRDTIVVHHKHHRQLSLFGKTHRLVKIALPGRRLAQRRIHHIRLAIQLHAPGGATGRQQMRTHRRWVTPNVQRSIAKMPGQLPAAAGRIPLGIKSQCQVHVTHAALHTKRTVAIIRKCIIIRLQVHSYAGQCLMPHTRNMKPAFALTNQVLLTQIAQSTAPQHTQQRLARVSIKPGAGS